MLEKEVLNLTLADFRSRFDTWLRKYKLTTTLGRLSRFTLNGTRFTAECAGRTIAGEFDGRSKRLLNIRLEDDFAWGDSTNEPYKQVESIRILALMTGLVHCVNPRIPMPEIERIFRGIGVEEGRTRDTQAFEHAGLRFTGSSSDSCLWQFEITRASQSSAVAPVLSA